MQKFIFQNLKFTWTNLYTDWRPQYLSKGNMFNFYFYILKICWSPLRVIIFSDIHKKWLKIWRICTRFVTPRGDWQILDTWNCLGSKVPLNRLNSTGVPSTDLRHSILFETMIRLSTHHANSFIYAYISSRVNYLLIAQCVYIVAQ